MNSSRAGAVRSGGVCRYAFLERRGLVCATSTRAKDLGFRDNSPLSLKEARSSVLDGLGVDYRRLVLPQQVHEATVSPVGEKDKGMGALDYGSTVPSSDGLVTDCLYLPLGILTADCLPLFLYSPDARCIGLIHAGWRGTRARLAQNAVKILCGKFNAKPRSLLALIGAGIRSCHYEVTAEIRDFFPGRLKPRGGRFYLDLASENARQLSQMGLRRENIFDSGLCTACDNRRFFSYRKEGPGAGRMLSVIMMK